MKRIEIKERILFQIQYIIKLDRGSGVANATPSTYNYFTLTSQRHAQ
nr:MAG TPA: hypothetical protein [Caudoviricetes sp.]